jgi:uncharacterized linocin/CFP29 family protein
LSLVELRADFAIKLSELRDYDRGRPDVDLDEFDEAATRSRSPRTPPSSMAGRRSGSPASRKRLRTRHRSSAPGGVVSPARRGGGRAPARDRDRGPYALALGRDQYTRVVETAGHGGYPLLDHLRKILDGPVVWAPGVEGAVVVSQRGGDFRFESGQDFAIGYDRHDADAAQLYLEQSFSFVVATPEAAVPLGP